MTNMPLQDLNVLDFSWVVAGPAVGRALADFGASVIRVETTKKVDTARLIGPFHDGITGREHSALYGNVNAGKYGMTLDMSNDKAREVVLDLVRWADIVVESFSPGVMKKWGLDYETLRGVNPTLIMLSTSILGNTGPYSKFAGFGNLGSAMSGIMNIAGWPDEPPKGPFGPYTDFVGPRFSLVMVLSALDHARRTGEGCYIDLSQVETGIHFIAQGILNYSVNQEEIVRNGNAHDQMAPHGVYRCIGKNEGNVSYVAISVNNDEQWKKLAELVGGIELAGNESFFSLENRIKNSEIIDEILNKWTEKKSAHEVERLLQIQGIPAHVVASSEDAVSDMQLQQQGHFVELDHHLHNKTVVEASRYSLSETPAKISRPAPTFGQDNNLILENILKYDESRISALYESDVLQ